MFATRLSTSRDFGCTFTWPAVISRDLFFSSFACCRDITESMSWALHWPCHGCYTTFVTSRAPLQHNVASVLTSRDLSFLSRDFFLYVTFSYHYITHVMALHASCHGHYITHVTAIGYDCHATFFFITWLVPSHNIYRDTTWLMSWALHSLCDRLWLNK